MNEHTLKMILTMVEQFILPMAEKYVEQSKNEYDDMALRFVKGGIAEVLKFLDEKQGNGTK
jgi:hypothetical protein